MVSLKKKKIREVGKKVIDTEVQALKKLKLSLNETFEQSVEIIANCKSKIIFCGVGKSFRVAAKISSTMASIGSPSFVLSANDCSHGDLGSISKKDVLVMMSHSGQSEELTNVIDYAKKNKVKLIAITSKKNTKLFKSANVGICIPDVKEAGLGLVPTSSTSCQLALGDALAIATMKYKNFNKSNYKDLHPAGKIGSKLKTVNDIMLTGKKIPFIKEQIKMSKAIKTLLEKKLGLLVVKNKQNLTSGILVDGDIKRAIKKFRNIDQFEVKNLMTKNPVSVEKNTLLSKALAVMSDNKITSLCVFEKGKNKKTIGIVHIHNLLETIVL